ncbi:E3 ubiquitin-protein ligase RNF144B-like [Clupea harengus]|uniref:RBR-type E3 ubiquitin transferase n=1 Tax=Clupea harengus TaxID=7950 RepID=A0A8M1KDE9_CLUHA|nr:E3 ubiquitin-protein ligase RNF144B-like [Clupea harengus]
MADSTSTPLTVFCKLCLSHNEERDTSALHACGCVFCTQCLQHYVSLAVREGGGALITCPDLACRGAEGLSDSEVACFVSEGQAELYKRLKFERGTVWWLMLVQVIVGHLRSTGGHLGALMMIIMNSPQGW